MAADVPTYDELMRRLAHCSDCGCEHRQPDRSCGCECHLWNMTDDELRAAIIEEISVPVFYDERLNYVEVQITRVVWEEAHRRGLVPR